MPIKEHANVEKHGVDFLEVSTVFGDPFECTGPDPSFEEHRLLNLGILSRNRVLVVSDTERSENRIRSISARLASRRQPRGENRLQWDPL